MAASFPTSWTRRSRRWGERSGFGRARGAAVALVVSAAVTACWVGRWSAFVSLSETGAARLLSGPRYRRRKTRQRADRAPERREVRIEIGGETVLAAI